MAAIGAETMDDLARTEDDLRRIERDARRLHAEGRLDDAELSRRLAVVTGIRRVGASGRHDLAAALLRAWLDEAETRPA